MKPLMREDKYPMKEDKYRILIKVDSEIKKWQPMYFDTLKEARDFLKKRDLYSLETHPDGIEIAIRYDTWKYEPLSWHSK